ncbi:MAG: hypothetical protein K9W42_04085 [Candidatus Heimdallarchaeota archaeon]|nr:hypothetical protein [Candidatus Heimdallarchaeota archaeon]
MKNVEINSVEDVYRLLQDKHQLGKYLFAMIKEVESLRKELDEFKKNYKPRLRI